VRHWNDLDQEMGSAGIKQTDGMELIAGRYRVEALLGEGGMGSVYRARDEYVGSSVAVKRLHAGSERAKVVLFEQEYFTLAELAHPRIIEVYDYGVDAGRSYYTMELLDGADLRDAGALDFRTVCGVLSDVAGSLAILHSRGFLHRDVSPRNVRRTADGRAKLIDFGAMSRMGNSKELVGTPPCVAPEVLHGQVCDGRADLYSLGVVGYWMLTGRYPYPARSFDELSDLWSYAPVPLSKLAPDVPAALEELIADLIGLEPKARPRTAGEVVERLSAIAGLPPADDKTIAGAYLSSPTLVGREEFLSWARSRLRSVNEGSGKVLSIEGESGTGLSRALSACAAEGKRLGAAVLLVTAADAGTGDFGIARSLARQLERAMPEARSLAFASELPLVEQLLSSGNESEDATGTVLPERRHLLVALRDWFVEASKRRRLVIAVDDAHAADEPSLSLLAMLAERQAKAGIAIVLALRGASGTGLAFEMLARVGETFRLAPLSDAETEELVRSVFGDVDNVVGIAQTVHGRAQGRPREVMTYLMHLCDRGVARYEGAAWVLTDLTADSELPSSIGAVLGARLEALGPDAQRLARALALTEPSWLTVTDYETVVEISPARVYRALNALVSSGILVEDGSSHYFAGRAVPSWLSSGGDPSWEASVHARLAALASRRGRPLRRLHHLIESGQASVAIRELVDKLGTEILDYSAASIQLIERALSATGAPTLEGLGRNSEVPERYLVELRLRLVGVAAMCGDLDTFRRYAPAELARLRRESGLDEWAALSADLPPGERLQTALVHAHETHLRMPAIEAGFSPFEAIARLARLCAGFIAMAGTASDRTILDALPSLAPFETISPALALIEAGVSASRALEEGRFVKARAAFAALLQRLSSVEGLEPAHRDQMRYGWTYVAGSIDATYGLPTCLEFAAELEKVPRYRSAAWHMRRSYFRMLGKFDQARDCQRHMELLELRDGPQTFKNVNYRMEMASSALSDDVVALKSLAATVDAAAERLPRLRVLAGLIRAQYHRIRGEFQAALDCITPILALAEPNASIDWVPTASTHVGLLVLNGRVEEACREADRYLEACDDAEHGVAELEEARALALAAAGRAPEAARLCDAVIESEERRGTQGLRMARCYQARARVALAMGDNEAFVVWTNRFVEFCATTESSSIRSQANRLTQEGRALGVEEVRDIELPITRMEGVDRMQTLHSQLASCTDRTERAFMALSLVVQAFGAQRGHLYGLQGRSLQRLASLPEEGPPEDLTTELEEFVARQYEDGARTQLSAPFDDVADATRQDHAGYRVRPLYSDVRGKLALVGVVALGDETEGPSGTSRRVLKAIADTLVQRGDFGHSRGKG
jgi:tetratricopeptide (TPR) repeat protein